jgi:hypothetical protein
MTLHNEVTRGTTPWTNKAWRRKAQVCFPGVDVRQAMTTVAQVILVNVYEWDGDWKRAIELWYKRAMQ